MKGSWMLVRMRGGRDGGDDWLLIKHRDEWAKDGDDDKLLEQGPIGRLGAHHGSDRARRGQGARKLQAVEVEDEAAEIRRDLALEQIRGAGEYAS